MEAAKGWAVVTGASSGLGLHFARALVARGYPVLAVARREDKLQELAREATGRGGRLEVLAADLQKREDVRAVADRAEELGSVELLVNNAGFASYGVFTELPLERELEQIQLNVVALVELTHRLAGGMAARRRGGIINVASTVAFQPNPYFATYGATKAFVLSFTEAVAHEMKDKGVRALAVCPGPVTTEFAAVASSQELEKKIPNLAPEDVVSAALAAFDAGRVVKVVGVVNKILAFFPRIMPRPIMRAIMSGFMKPAALKALPA